MIQIIDEDKIALLEFLGYSISHKIAGDNVYTDGESLYFHLSTFNPLDISILTKAMNIIESKECETQLMYNPHAKDIGKYHFYILNKYSKTIAFNRGNTREEAILSAILQYIKQLKS